MSKRQGRGLNGNDVIRRLRGARSRANLAARFEQLCRELRREAADPSRFQVPSRETIEKQIYRIETGATTYPNELYATLYCRYFDKTPQELFGELPSPPAPDSETFCFRNHKLIPLYVGPDSVQTIIHQLDMNPGDSGEVEGPPCHYIAVNHPRDLSATLWVWSFGVALFHVIETVQLPSLAHLAYWHKAAYDEQMEWATEQAAILLGSSEARAQYAMPINWLVRSIWSTTQTQTALRILTMPRVLLTRDAAPADDDFAHAEIVARTLMTDGFDSAHVAEFGVRGMSLGVASWAGVAYHPTAPARALSEHEVISFELILQALWSYCDWIRSEVEAGRDPDVRPEYGWRLLRTLRSIVTTPRPEENSQIFPLRAALLETSGILAHLTQASDALAETRSSMQ